MNDKEIVELLHTGIHGLRLMQNYKPSAFEQKLSKIVCERFQNTCSECKERFMKYKYAPETPQKQGFLGGLIGK